MTTTRSMIIGSLAGVASAVLVLTAASGPFGFLLSYLVPLPLFFAGLTHGLPAIGIAGAAGALISAFNGLQAGGSYLVIFAVPAVLVTRQALLARPAAEAAPGAEVNDGLEWYPAGGLVVWLTYSALGLFALALLLTAGREGGLPGMLQPKIEQILRMITTEMQPRSDGKTVDAAAAATGLAQVLPSALGLGWLTMMAINGTLAQGLATMVKQNRRPTPRYSAMTLPRSLVLAFGAAVIAGVLLPDDMSFIAVTAAAVLAFPFFLQGLAVVHRLAAKAALQGMVLAAFYAALVLGTALVAVPVLILGFIEQWAGFRRRLAGAGASQEKI